MMVGSFSFPFASYISELELKTPVPETPTGTNNKIPRKSLVSLAKGVGSR